MYKSPPPKKINFWDLLRLFLLIIGQVMYMLVYYYDIVCNKITMETYLGDFFGDKGKIM